MLATLIIVFREVLEAGLIVGIVLSATKGMARRGVWVSYGVAGGAGGACVVAGFASEIAGPHVCHAMLLPRPESAALAAEFAARGALDLGAARLTRIGKAAHLDMINPRFLNAEDDTTLAQTETAARFYTMGVENVPMTPAELGAFQRAELVKWAKLVKDGNVKV